MLKRCSSSQFVGMWHYLSNFGNFLASANTTFTSALVIDLCIFTMQLNSHVTYRILCRHNPHRPRCGCTTVVLLVTFAISPSNKLSNCKKIEWEWDYVKKIEKKALVIERLRLGQKDWVSLSKSEGWHVCSQPNTHIPDRRPHRYVLVRSPHQHTSLTILTPPPPSHTYTQIPGRRPHQVCSDQVFALAHYPHHLYTSLPPPPPPTHTHTPPWNNRYRVSPVIAVVLNYCLLLISQNFLCLVRSPCLRRLSHTDTWRSWLGPGDLQHRCSDVCNRPLPPLCISPTIPSCPHI